MQDKAVVPQAASWGGVRYLYFYFPDATPDPQEGGGSCKQPPGAAFELDLGLMRPSFSKEVLASSSVTQFTGSLRLRLQKVIPFP